MEFNPEVWWVWTKDGVRLQGMHYFPQNKDVCVLFIHGMSGTFVDSIYAEELGHQCVSSGIGFVYAHNRGWAIMNEISIKDQNGKITSIRNGAVYEKFKDSLLDIDVFVDRVLAEGYQKIVLVGHSYGGSKTIHYLSQINRPEIIGLVLASAADMVGLTKKVEGENYQKRVDEARELVVKGKGDELMQFPLADWVRLSAQTYLDEGVDGADADVLPIFRNPDVFPELASITMPILAILGDQDSVIVRSIQEDFEVMKAKAIRAKSFSSKVIENCDHIYTDCEAEFATIITNFVITLVQT